MAVKRRTVWIGDDDWSLMEAVARRQNVSVSLLIVDGMRRGHLRQDLERIHANSAEGRHESAQRANAAERAAIAERIDSGFGHSRPAPKPGKGR